MTWVRLEDTFPEHPKVLAAGDAATMVFIRGLCYSARYLTDGFVPLAAARTLGTARQVTTLVAIHLWDQADGGYRIHDYLRYNPTRAQVEAKRTDLSEKRAAAGRLGGRATFNREDGAKQNASKAESKTQANEKQNESPGRGKQNESPVPIPDPARTRPRKTSQETENHVGTTGSGGKPRGTRLEPLVNAFSAAGLRQPYFAAGNSSAAQALLPHYSPRELADCWRDIEQGAYGDEFLRRNLSFRTLAANDAVGKWQEWDRAGRRPNGSPRSPGPRNGDAVDDLAEFRVFGA
jgi:hypothetical protein